MSGNGRLPTWKEIIDSGDRKFNKRKYEEALCEYEKALKMTPRNVNLKISRAETLVCLGRLWDGFDEFSEAYRIDSTSNRLWHRMCLFYLRLGMVDRAENCRLKAHEAYREDLRVKIARVKDLQVRALTARNGENWVAALREIDAMIAAGVDYSLAVMAFRAEMFLKLHSIEEAKGTMQSAGKLKMPNWDNTYFCGIPLLAYVWGVSAQIQLALGRSESALERAEKARRLAYTHSEICDLYTHVRLVHRGNRHCNSGDYLIALQEYKVALKDFKPNVSLLINLATCHWKLEMWKDCIEICNQVLQIRPDNNAQRADSYAKLGNWAESVKDYEAANKICPGNKEIMKGLKESQAALTELAETPVEAQDAVHEPQVCELSETRTG